MRLLLFALLVVGLALALLLLLRRPPPPIITTTTTKEEPRALPPLPTVTIPPRVTTAGNASTTVNASLPPPAPSIGPAHASDNDAAIAEWHAHSDERDYAYWDMKLAMLRKIEACVGDKMQRLGAAEVTFHFKKQDGAWIADTAELRDPNDEERDTMGAVELRGADRELAQKCIGEAFAGVTMPMVGTTDQYEQYDVRGQIMFPPANDKAWKQTGVNP